MIQRKDIVKAARGYLNVPYGNQGRSMQAMDCGGLLLCVCADLGAIFLEVTGYSNSPDGKAFESYLTENLDEIKPKTDAKIGDIIAIDYGEGIQHTAFITQTDPYLMVIHAKRERGVIEHRLMRGMEDFDKWTRSFALREVTD